MATFSVSTGELTSIAGQMGSQATGVLSAGTTIGSIVGIGVGLPGLDGALEDLATSLGGWLAQAGTDLQTLSYNTQFAADGYAIVEATNAGVGGTSSGSSSGSTGSSGSGGGLPFLSPPPPDVHA